MSSKKKMVIRIIFIVILVCFFLPFVSVSCSNQTIHTFSGFNLVTGGSYNVSDQMGLGDAGSLFGTSTNVPDTKYGAQFFVILAFLAAVAGLIVSFVKSRKNILFAAVISAAGFLFTLLSTGSIGSQVKSKTVEAGALLQVKYDAGFYLILIGFIAAAAYGFYAVYAKPAAGVQNSGPMYTGAPYTEPAPESPGRYCSNCGSPMSPGNEFCVNCGQKAE